MFRHTIWHPPHFPLSEDKQVCGGSIETHQTSLDPGDGATESLRIVEVAIDPPSNVAVEDHGRVQNVNYGFGRHRPTEVRPVAGAGLAPLRAVCPDCTAIGPGRVSGM